MIFRATGAADRALGTADRRAETADRAVSATDARGKTADRCAGTADRPAGMADRAVGMTAAGVTMDSYCVVVGGNGCAALGRTRSNLSFSHERERPASPHIIEQTDSDHAHNEARSAVAHQR